VKGIIGSGFGIYGHMPAFFLSSCERICLPYRYKKVIQSRSELKTYLDAITWCRDEEVLISIVDTLTICVAPSIQGKWIEKSITNHNINKLFLEKPLSSNPDSSLKLLNKLVKSDKIFRINYSFLYTNWFSQITNFLKNCARAEIRIQWRFLADHYRRNLTTWKRQNENGGSVLRYYGIHFMAILADLGLSEAKLSQTNGKSPNDCYLWTVACSNEKINVDLSIDANCEDSSFILKCTNLDLPNNELHIKLKDPFSLDLIGASTLDPRIGVLNSFHESLDRKSNNYYYELYYNANNLWKRIEEINTFKRTVL
jgi:predicted dehydrogenase